MKLSEFDYYLPEELIAQVPLQNRSTSRLMVLHRDNETLEHKHFYDIVDYLKPGDVLVRNNTRVIPARLFGTKEETGAHVELLILKQDGNTCECLVGNARVVKINTIISFGNGELKAKCIEIKEEAYGVSPRRDMSPTCPLCFLIFIRTVEDACPYACRRKE